MAGCLTCNTAGCTSCDTALTFTLNATSNLCDCALGNYINSYKKCSVCVMIGCADCTAEDVCRQCSPGYALNGAICDEVCGDGMLFVLPCDDGNLLDGDGCSKTCQIEQDYDCVGGSAT
jgi:cysteine-rich repeat protein